MDADLSLMWEKFSKPHRQAAQEKHTPASLILEGKFKIELKKKLSFTGVIHNKNETFFFRDEYSPILN